MLNENQETQIQTNNIFSVLAGMLIGGLAGAVTMLLLAPRSGKDTRSKKAKEAANLKSTEISSSAPTASGLV